MIIKTKAQKHPWKDFDKYDYYQIQQWYEKGYTKKFIAEHLGINYRTLNKIIKHYRWKRN